MTQPDTPFLEKPEEHAPEEGRLYCFLDSSRPCTSECVAFLPARPEGADYEGQQWTTCMLLVNLHKLGKHHVALASQGQSLLKHLRVKDADARRENQPLPPKVT